MCKERRLKVVSIRDLTLNELFDVVQANKFRMKVSVIPSRLFLLYIRIFGKIFNTSFRRMIFINLWGFLIKGSKKNSKTAWQ